MKLLIIGNPGDGITLKVRELHAALQPADDQTRFEHEFMLRGAGFGQGDLPMSSVPFRAPYHTCSHIAMLGGVVGRTVRPGEVSFAHGGTLWISESLEYRRSTLSALYSVLEKGYSDFHWSTSYPVSYPARPQLVVLDVPKCFCGRTACTCSPVQLERYKRDFDNIVQGFQPDEVLTLPAP